TPAPPPVPHRPGRPPVEPVRRRAGEAPPGPPASRPEGAVPRDDAEPLAVLELDGLGRLDQLAAGGVALALELEEVPLLALEAGGLEQPGPGDPSGAAPEIGRASCRERVWSYG